jgi:hypothetical protein
MKIYPVKLRNRAIPDKPITVSANFAFSKIRGEFALNEVCGIGKEGEKKADKMVENWIMRQAADISEEEAAALNDEFLADLDNI